MRIAHIGLASYFTEGMTYQDNQLTEQNARDGHDVLYISNASKYVDGKVVDTGYEDLRLSNGVRLVRMPYTNVLAKSLTERLRFVKVAALVNPSPVRLAIVNVGKPSPPNPSAA